MSFVRESTIVFNRQVRMNLRNPAWVFIGVMQPVLYLVLFGPLLKPLVGDFGAENAYTFLVPGLLRELDRTDITLDSIEVHRPTLDDVFLTLTGRSLRDAEAGADAEQSETPEQQPETVGAEQ